VDAAGKAYGALDATYGAYYELRWGASRQQSRRQPDKIRAGTRLFADASRSIVGRMTELVASSADSRIRSHLGSVLLLIVLPVAIFAQTWNYGMVLLDDRHVVASTSQVWRGLSWENIAWAFRVTPGSLWQPAVLISLMIDVELFGHHFGGFHATNVLLHVANAILFYALLFRMTGSIGKSLIAAALWSVHPLRVESVAWITERKDVLCIFFGLLSLHAYVAFVRTLSLRWMAAAWGMMLFGLMAKQMLVTLPFVMLLLDYWPLRHVTFKPSDSHIPGDSPRGGITPRTPLALLLEKIPFFVLTVVFCLVAVLAQKSGGVVRDLESYSLPVRVGNALAAYAWYLGKTFWPTHLAVYYPHPGDRLSISTVLLSAMLLAAVTWAVVRELRRRPFLAVGWFWFLGTLVPVIGLVQVGGQGMADRFTYLPQMGLFIALVWGTASLLPATRSAPKWAATAIAGMAMLALSLCSWRQTQYWQNDFVLFERALAVTEHNDLVHNNLAVALLEAGKTAEARKHIDEALRINPRHVNAHNNLGSILRQEGDLEGAIRAFEETLKLSPEHSRAHGNLGRIRYEQGRMSEALAHLQQAVRIEPDFIAAHQALAIVLDALGRHHESVPHHQIALEHSPDDPVIHNNLGNALHNLGELKAAIAHFETSVRLDPDDAGPRNNLAVALRDAGRLEEAVQQFREALKRDPRNSMALNNLGIALFMQRKLDEAHAAFQQSLAIEPDYPLVHANLGILALERGERDEAIRHLEEAIRLDPGFAGARQLLDQIRQQPKK